VTNTNPHFSTGDSGVARMSTATNISATAVSRNQSRITPSNIELSMVFLLSFPRITAARAQLCRSSRIQICGRVGGQRGHGNGEHTKVHRQNENIVCSAESQRY
jgi:hypothetical protein